MSSGTAIVKAQGGLNVRKGAGTSYAKIGALTDGSKVNFNGEKDGWLKINYSGQTGYICKQYTSVTSTSTSSQSSQSSQSTSQNQSTSSSSKSVEVTATALNVRKGPGTSYGKIGSLSQGKVVAVTGESNGWYKFSFQGQEGWISAQYTKAVSSGGSSTPSKPESDSSEQTMNEKYTVTANSLNVRSGAGTQNGKIGSLSYGEVVTAVASSNGWFKIKYGSGYGWISGDYVQKGDHGGSSGSTFTGTVGAGGLRYLSTKQVAAIETGRKAKTIVDLKTKKQFNVSWDACATYHSDCTPMTQSDTNVMKSILNASKDPSSSYWNNISSWSWDGRPGAIQLKDGGWVACGFHMRPHAAIMGGNPGYPFKSESNTPLSVPENGSKWRLGGHFCMYYGDSPGGTPSCNTAAKTAKDMSL